MVKMLGESWVFLVSWALLGFSQFCAAQTYPYTITDTVTNPYPATGDNNYLYDADFTVYGNVKTIAVAAHGEANPAPADNVPTIEVYQATYNAPFPAANEYTLVASLDAVNTPGAAATQLGYAIEGGQSVKTSEIIVGTTIHDSAGGIYADGAGAAYVFKQFSAATWSQTARLQPSDLTDVNGDKFGASVAVDEFDPRRVMVGAPLASESDTGAVYFYQGSPTAKYWTEGQKLMPDNPVPNSRFGDEIEMFGRFAAITQPETCEVYIFEQERPKPKPKPKTRSPCDTSPTAAPVAPTPSPWKPLVQHETLRWSQQQVLNFTNNPTYNCDVGGRTRTYETGVGDTGTFEPGLNDHDPGYGDPAGGGYGGYLSLSMFEDTLAIGVPGYDEGNRVRTDYRDFNPTPSLCWSTCTYYNPIPNPVFPGSCSPYSATTVGVPANRQGCCPNHLNACTNANNPGVCGSTTVVPNVDGGPLHLGHCAEYPYAPGDNGIVYIYDMETFKGDCDRENYFPTVLSFDELVNLRDSDNDSSGKDDDKDDDCHEHHKPKPKPQCEVSRWSMQTSLTSPSPATSDGRVSDCQNFGYSVDVYKDVVTVNEVNTMSYDIGNPASTPTAVYETFDYPSIPDLLLDEYHCMSNLYYPHYSETHTSQPLVKESFVYAYEKTSSNTWSHIGNTVSGYELNTDPRGIEAVRTQAVGTDVFTLESSANSYTFDVQSTDNTWQCMVVTLMDQFGDGWGGAELQITDSDGRKQTFAPYCDSPGTTEPFVYTFRWCPDDWQDGDEVKMEILHSPSTKFRWELEWSVYFEWNQQVVYGDWETKMTLSYDTIGSQVLRLKHAEHLLNTSAACVECDRYTANPTSAPSSKPVHPKPKPKKSKKPSQHPTPTPSNTRRSLFSQDFDQEYDYDGSFEGFAAETEEFDEWAEEEAPSSHLRNLHHKSKTSVRTHSPTMSPAPTMVQTTFNTWEQITLTGGEASGSRNGWDETYNVNGYAVADIPMRYFISDKEGKHLFYEGTKCVDGTVVCWNDLPPGDRDYILRVGGAATPASAPANSETWLMCGISGVKMEQLDFRVKDYITSNLNSEECDALLKVNRATYCQNTLNLMVPVNGIIVLEQLLLDSFSQLDLELLGHAISLVFSPTTLLEVSFQKHMHSTRGAHVGFSIEVPSSVFGLDATDFDTINATGVNAINLLKKADLGSTVDTLLLDYSALGLESSLNSHGKVYLEDLAVAEDVKANYVANPFYYVDMDDDADTAGESSGGSLTGDSSSATLLDQILDNIQDHFFVFLMLLAGAVMYVRRRQSRDEDDEDLEAVHFHRSERKKGERESLVPLPFSSARVSSSRSKDKDRGRERDRDRAGKHKKPSSRGSSKKHKYRGDEEKESRSEREHVAASTLKERASVLRSHVWEGGDDATRSPSSGVSGRDTDRYAQRFVPYGNAAEVAVEEGWANQRTAGGGGSDKHLSGRVDVEEEEEEYGDELDNILSQFDSTSSSGSESSDDWEHA